ncbi:uncharacterized protein LOC110436464 [Sorghum bicolor]|uniref:uncharacterized protein LOC110436464 n=1 Tax=Sorghum bicolor TaxID=4558 RepID=UPI000B42683F|nr:uncharacterized protein LOC110436464 [Sorghum bicolor]|eukprot:XP_021319240.1 uncharacterized protein LOC110436464 [Sorghum bicolor]
MSSYDVAKGKPEQFTPEEEKTFLAADNLFRGAVISALDKKYVDNYIICTTAKELWDALEAKFRVSDAGSELYLMEQLFDYKMVDCRSVIEQAHEIQALAKELEQFPCVLPKKFVAGGIIAKLPLSWKNFATSLKHQRKEFGLAELMETLDVEEKARAKDTYGKGVESSSANVVQKKKQFTFRNKKKNKQENKQGANPKPKQTATFKKKKAEGGCFTGNTGALLMGNGSHARVLGVGTVILKFTSGKTVLMKNVQHVASNKKNLVSGSQLCRDGYKIVFEANKVILSKFGTFIGKGFAVNEADKCVYYRFGGVKV